MLSGASRLQRGVETLQLPSKNAIIPDRSPSSPAYDNVVHLAREGGREPRGSDPIFRAGLI